MSEEIITKPARKPRAKKVAEKAPEIINATVEEVLPVDINDVITGPEKVKTARKSNTKSNKSNVISSNAADIVLEKQQGLITEENTNSFDDNKSAIWSDRNMRWSDFGTISKGYNIVTKEAAVKWLELAGIREASPEEIAAYYGN